MNTPVGRSASHFQRATLRGTPQSAATKVCRATAHISPVGERIAAPPTRARPSRPIGHAITRWDSPGTTGSLWWTAIRPDTTRSVESEGSGTTSAQMLGQSSADQMNSRATSPVSVTRFRPGVQGQATSVATGDRSGKDAESVLLRSGRAAGEAVGEQVSSEPQVRSLRRFTLLPSHQLGRPNVHSRGSDLGQEFWTVPEGGLLAPARFDPQRSPDGHRAAKDRLGLGSVSGEAPPDVPAEGDLRDALESRLDHDGFVRRQGRLPGSGKPTWARKAENRGSARIRSKVGWAPIKIGQVCVAASVASASNASSRSPRAARM